MERKKNKIGQYRGITLGVLWRMCAGVSAVPSAHKLSGMEVE